MLLLFLPGPLPKSSCKAKGRAPGLAAPGPPGDAVSHLRNFFDRALGANWGGRRRPPKSATKALARKKKMREIHSMRSSVQR